MTGSKKHILMVDNDAALQESLSEQLQQNGEFTLYGAPGAGPALDTLATHPPDLILLAAGLPDMPGAELCRLLRQRGLGCPIILLGGPAAPDCGANAWLAKPFRLSELLGQIRGLLRAVDGDAGRGVRIGRFSFIPAARRLVQLQSGASVRLTEKEAAILHYLFRAGPASAVARDELLRHVWGYNPSVSTHTLETHIYRLRQKLEENPAEARILLTEPGGYRLAP